MSKSGTKSARIGTLLEQLQKLSLAVTESKYEQEKDFDQLRYITNKVQQMLSTQEKIRKDMMTKHTDGISTLLDILELSNDSQLTMNVMGCLSELLTTGKRASVLAAKGAVDIVLKIIVNASHENPLNEEVILLGHVLLTKVGPKDRKFCIKARLTGAIHITLALIRNNTTNFRVLQPTLLVMKQYTSNAVNCNTLSKDGAVAVLFKIVVACGHKRITCLKLVLEVLSSLVKSKSSAFKAVKYGAVPILLQMFCDWHRTDHHNRQTAVRKCIISVLKSITMTKSGKKAFIQSDGIKILYSLSLESLESHELDGVNTICSQILRRCFPVNKLPIPCYSSPLSFPLLDLDSALNHTVEAEDDAEGDSGEEEDESSDLESEDELSSSVKEDKEETSSKVQNGDEENIQLEGKQKGRDDLQMYEKFFPEQVEYQVVNDDSMYSHSTLGDAIMIPTASDDPLSPLSSLSNLYSGPDSFSNNVLQDGGSSSSQSPRECTSQEKLGNQSHITSRSSSAAENLHSVLPIIKQASPEIYGHYPPTEQEPLRPKKSSLQRTMILQDIERVIQPKKVLERVVFDLDELLKENGAESNTNLKEPTKTRENLSRKGSTSSSSSSSELDRMSSDDGSRSLKFESRFECGNLRKAIQVREHEYDLILSSDINNRRYHQWFYFEVSNMEADVPYKFNILNCFKVNSQFNFGMQPVMYSTQEALAGQPGWIRTGTNICYYRNQYCRVGDNHGGKTYFTTTFTIRFPYSEDTCYLAYHYPYSYTMLQEHLSHLEASVDRDIFFHRATLCHTLAGNPCNVITITAAPRSRDDLSLKAFRDRPYVFLTSRVHPSETNSSWVMKGVLDFLTSDYYTAKNLRDRFIFKIVPMLNIDGVVNGSHRCSLSGDDLNRQWLNPSMILHPIIYHTKGLLQYLKNINKPPIVYCDFHGHSRKKNVFMYGCNKAGTLPSSLSSSVEVEAGNRNTERSGLQMSETDSSSSMDASDVLEDAEYRSLPRVLHNIAPTFSMGSCSFLVEPSKESTARVVVWREIGVIRSYTMESTYCGCDQGPYKGYHIGTREHEEMGRFLCAGILKIGRPYLKQNSSNQLSQSSDTNSDSRINVSSENWIRTSDLFVPISAMPCDY
ncbi:cytosolic carboxypeptidase 1-like [Actinia tenebrosa]|uniref:tubulin-glutamate carboxypeptidase n=1 Tax=Actinia tenebrosa TaxID=6105 RepID=A0A6P8HZL5_ACTTE|nr:cytosolic carboxypeptidase 1-like [Actinia tenebrosa]